MCAYVYRKHLKQHDKPLRCDVPDCTFGFGEVKDLNRHKEVDHNIPPPKGKKSFMATCSACGDRQREDDLNGRHLKTCRKLQKTGNAA